MREAVKNSSLFVGTVVGAGFASGREVALFFKGNSPVVAFFAGIILGLCCTLFMLLGKNTADLDGKLFGKYSNVFKVLSGLANYVIFLAMLAGAEYIMFEMFNIRFFGIVSAVAVMLVSARGMEQIKMLNMVVVPLILLLVSIIYFKSGEYYVRGTVSAATPLGYAAMNMLSAGYVMAAAGKNTTAKSAVYTGLFSGILLAVLLYAVQATVFFRTEEAMPLYAAAAESGIEKAGGILIYLAVITTFAASANLLYIQLNEKVNSSLLSSLILIAPAWFITVFVSFGQAVDYGYPLVSVMGIILTIRALFVFLHQKSAAIKHGALQFKRN